MTQYDVNTISTRAFTQLLFITAWIDYKNIYGI